MVVDTICTLCLSCVWSSQQHRTFHSPTTSIFIPNFAFAIRTCNDVPMHVSQTIGNSIAVCDVSCQLAHPKTKNKKKKKNWNLTLTITTTISSSFFQSTHLLRVRRRHDLSTHRWFFWKTMSAAAAAAAPSGNEFLYKVGCFCSFIQIDDFERLRGFLFFF